MRLFFYYISTINISYVILCLFIPIGELHVFWRDDYSEVDVFLFSDYRIYTEWLVRDISSMVQLSMISFLLLRQMKGNKALKSIAIAIFWYSIGDMIMYFVTFKTIFYGLFYICIAAFLIFREHFIPNNKTVKLTKK